MRRNYLLTAISLSSSAPVPFSAVISCLGNVAGDSEMVSLETSLTMDQIGSPTLLYFRRKKKKKRCAMQISHLFEKSNTEYVCDFVNWKECNMDLLDVCVCVWGCYRWWVAGHDGLPNPSNTVFCCFHKRVGNWSEIRVMFTTFHSPIGNSEN